MVLASYHKVNQTERSATITLNIYSKIKSFRLLATIPLAAHLWEEGILGQKCNITRLLAKKLNKNPSVKNPFPRIHLSVEEQ